MDKFRGLLRRYKFIVNLLVLLVGVALLLVGTSFKPSLGEGEENSKDTEIAYDILVGIGSSVTATATITLFLLALLPDDIENEELKILEEWGISRIHGERRTTALSGRTLPKNQLDYIAFGLKHFREANKGANSDLVKRLRSGLNIRIITLYPKSQYVTERQRLEKRDGLSDEIMALWKWKEDMLEFAGTKRKGSIEIKYYNNLPLDFYCRADNRLFVGPYMPGEVSGENITYEFKVGDTKGGRYYTQIFDTLWEGKVLNFLDHNVPYLIGNQASSVENALKHFCKELVDSDCGQDPIGIVVMFKKEQRRTIFSCNKKRDERHNCYLKDRGTVGHLINLNQKPKAGFKILFEDLKNKLAFVSHHTDTLEVQRREKFEDIAPDHDDNTIAILAIPIISNDQLVGAITFDFYQLPKKYEDEVEALEKVELDENLASKENLEIQRWFMLAESCRKIIEPMLGDEMELQYKNLFEEEWKI